VKEIASTLLIILWRAILLFPLALAFFILVAAYLLAPSDLIIYALFVSPWYWITLPAWALSLYLLRMPLQSYFKNIGESWL
jgi:hypothetical protein